MAASLPRRNTIQYADRQTSVYSYKPLSTYGDSISTAFTTYQQLVRIFFLHNLQTAGFDYDLTSQVDIPERVTCIN